MSTNATPNDQAILDLIRSRGPLSVSELVDLLGVTATAVRHRLNRLTAAELVDRVDRRHGRGRPVHKYSLTEKGCHSMGDNFSDFAKVLWSEVQKIEDDTIRQSVIQGVVNRLSEMYEAQIHGDTVDERLSSIAKLFGDRDIPFVVESSDQKPVLKIVGCPYPELTDDNNKICELEQQLFSQLATIPLSVDRCQCDSGGNCCTFQPDQASRTS